MTPELPNGHCADDAEAPVPIPFVPEHFWLYRALCHPLLYALLIAFLLAVDLGGWLPVPSRPAPRKRPTHQADHPAADAQSRPVTEFLGAHELKQAALVLLPLLIGLLLLLSYLFLRACNVRVFPPHQFRAAPWSGWHLARCVIVFLVIQRLAMAVLAYIQSLQATGHWLRKAPDAVLAVGVYNGVFVAACGFVFLLLWVPRQQPLRSLGLRDTHPVSRALAGVAAYLMILPAILAIGLILWKGFGINPEEHQQELLREARRLPQQAFLIVAFSGVVIAPITEEILFRGFLYATLRRYLGPAVSIILTALVFAGLHGFLYGLLQLFLLGALLAYLYERTGSLVAPIAAHAANNLYTFAIQYHYTLSQ